MPMNIRALPVNVTQLGQIKNTKKSILSIRKRSHKRDEMYMHLASDRQVQAIFNMLQSGRLNLEAHL